MYNTTTTNTLPFYCEDCDKVFDVRVAKVYKVRHKGLKREDSYTAIKTACPDCWAPLETDEELKYGRGSTKPGLAPATNRVTGTDLKVIDRPRGQYVPPADLEEKLSEEKRLREQREKEQDDAYVE